MGRHRRPFDDWYTIACSNLCAELETTGLQRVFFYGS
jgi:hypothetical protein